MSATNTNAPTLSEYRAPFNWAAIDAEIHTHGGVIAKGLFTEPRVDALNADIDRYLEHHVGVGDPSQRLANVRPFPRSQHDSAAGFDREAAQCR